MAYVKNTWVDREGQTRYHETIDDDGALIFTPDYEKVTEMGTPVNADNMNHIEEGIEDHENRITVLENADGDNFVSKSGDTMTGDLTISTNTVPELLLQSTNFDYTSTTVPSSATAICRVVALDKNRKTTGCFQSLVDTGGSYITQIYARRSVGGTEKNGVISVAVKTDGTIFTSAPTPPTGDNSTNIATTAYCVNMRCTTKATTTSSASTTRPAWIVQNYVNGTSWYRVWSDGWIEQGGRVDNPGNSFTVTLLKAFTNTQYTIMCQLYSADNDTGGFSLAPGVTRGAQDANITTSSFRVSVGGAGFYWYACGY